MKIYTEETKKSFLFENYSRTPGNQKQNNLIFYQKNVRARNVNIRMYLAGSFRNPTRNEGNEKNGVKRSSGPWETHALQEQSHNRHCAYTQTHNFLSF